MLVAPAEAPAEEPQLDPNAMALVTRLKKQLELKSNVAVIRRALQELESKVARHRLQTAFREASLKVREFNAADMEELDQLSGEGFP
jgi:hypothetical protein